jgi:hypothetical protein
MTKSFVWTKMGIESGEGLEDIVRRKDAERIAGGGEFWWGIGSSLGAAVRVAARSNGGKLPVLFSKMLGRAKPADQSPEMIWKWTAWEDEHGRAHSLPSHAHVISRGAQAKEKHYALVCYSESPISLRRGGKPFDPTLCRTASGKVPGASQVTALLSGSPEVHKSGSYEISFEAALVQPWAVKLLRPIPVT